MNSKSEEKTKKMVTVSCLYCGRYKVTMPISEEEFTLVCPECNQDIVVPAYKIEKVERVTLPTLRCLRCGHTWFPRRKQKPKNCPKCISPYWDKERRERR